MQRRCGKISKKEVGKDGKMRLSLENDPTEYIAGAVVNGEVPEKGSVEIFGDFPTNLVPPHNQLPYFLFCDVRALS